MLTKEKLLEVERELKKAGISIASVCRKAGVNQTVWWKFTDGQSAFLKDKTQKRIIRAVNEALPGALQ